MYFLVVIYWKIKMGLCNGLTVLYLCHSIKKTLLKQTEGKKT